LGFEKLDMSVAFRGSFSKKARSKFSKSCRTGASEPKQDFTAISV
jgi:hypothetical protein